MHGTLRSGGEIVDVECASPRLARLIDEGADGGLTVPDRDPTVLVRVECDRRPFPTAGWSALGREAWERRGEVVARDVCTSGLDVLVRVSDGRPEFTFRWRPSPQTRGVHAALPARARLLARSVLLQYPVIWWAGTRGRVPLHASGVELDKQACLIAGPSGSGKSTVVAAEMTAGSGVTSDNLCVSDGRAAWGIVEPLRIEGAHGRRMPHGRREARLRTRVHAITPGLVLVLRRGADSGPAVEPCSAEVAARVLTAGTYMAGELRRYWPFAAMLALGTGIGPVHPSLGALVRLLVERVPSFAVQLTRAHAIRLDELLANREDALA